MSKGRESYLLGLQALALASERVREACQGEDMVAASIEAHFGLHAVYDLHEAYFVPRKIAGYALQDKVLRMTGGCSVGALALARGERTHKMVAFTTTGGFGDLPHGMGPYGRGWIWKKHSWHDPALQNRATWYRARVSQRMLWVPFDDAWKWFVEHIDDEMDRTKLFATLGLSYSLNGAGVPDPKLRKELRLQRSSSGSLR
jgi:hypothetical protein